MDDREAENVRQNSIRMKQKREDRTGLATFNSSGHEKITTRFNVTYSAPVINCIQTDSLKLFPILFAFQVR